MNSRNAVNSVVPTILAEWIVRAGMNSTSPALTISGGLPSSGIPKCLRAHRLSLRQDACASGRRSRLELNDHLDDLASPDVQVMPLEIDAPGLVVRHTVLYLPRPSASILIGRVSFLSVD